MANSSDISKTLNGQVVVFHCELRTRCGTGRFCGAYGWTARDAEHAARTKMTELCAMPYDASLKVSIRAITSEESFGGLR